MKKRSAFVCAALAAIMLTSGCGGSDNGKSESYSDSANGRNQPAAQAPSSVSPTPSPSPTGFAAAVNYKLELIDSKQLGYTATALVQFGTPVAAKDYPNFLSLGCGKSDTDKLVPFKVTVTNTASTAQVLQLSMYTVAKDGYEYDGRALYSWSLFSSGKTYCEDVKPDYAGGGTTIMGINSTTPVAPGKEVSFSGFYGVRDYYAPKGEAAALLNSLAVEFANVEGLQTYFVQKVVSGGTYGVLPDWSFRRFHFIPLISGASPCKTDFGTGLVMKCATV